MVIRLNVIMIETSWPLYQQTRNFVSPHTIDYGGRPEINRGYALLAHQKILKSVGS
jgi:hypothetical protein